MSRLYRPSLALAIRIFLIGGYQVHQQNEILIMITGEDDGAGVLFCLLDNLN
jgi:hypothetical protein